MAIHLQKCTANGDFVKHMIPYFDEPFLPPNTIANSERLLNAKNGVEINTDNLSWGPNFFFKDQKCHLPGRAKRGHKFIEMLLYKQLSPEKIKELLLYLVCINDSFHDFKILALDTYRGKSDDKTLSLITPFYSILADKLNVLPPDQLVRLKNIYSGLKVPKWYSFLLPPPSRDNTENFYLEKCMRYVCTYNTGEIKLFRNIKYPKRLMGIRNKNDTNFITATIEGIYAFFNDYTTYPKTLNVVADFQINFFDYVCRAKHIVNSLLTMESIYDSAPKTRESIVPEHLNIYLENFNDVNRDYAGILHPHLILKGKPDIKIEYTVQAGSAIFTQELKLNDGNNGTNKTNIRFGFLTDEQGNTDPNSIAKITERSTKFPKITFNADIPILELENKQIKTYKENIKKYFDLLKTEEYNSKKDKVFGLFAKKRLGDQCQAEVVKKINASELIHGFNKMSGNSQITSIDKCVLVTHDRMLAAYSLLRDVPFIYDNGKIFLVYKPNGGGGGGGGVAADPASPASANYTESTTNYLKNNILNTNFLHGGSRDGGGGAKPDSPFIDIYNMNNRKAADIIITTSPYLTYAYYLYCKRNFSQQRGVSEDVLNSIHLDTLSEFMSISNRGSGLYSCLVNPYVIPNPPFRPQLGRVYLEYGDTNSFIISVNRKTQEEVLAPAAAAAGSKDILERIYDSSDTDDKLYSYKEIIDIKLLFEKGVFVFSYFELTGRRDHKEIEITFSYPLKTDGTEIREFIDFMEKEQERIVGNVQDGGSNKPLTTGSKDTLNKCLELMNEYNKRTRENYEFKLIINEDEKEGAYINYDDTGTPLTWEKWLGYEVDDSFTFFEELINDDQFAELEINLRDNTINVDKMKEVENKKIFENMTEEERRLLTRRAYLKFKRMKKVGYTTDTNNLYDKIQKLYEQLKIEGVVEEERVLLKQVLPEEQEEQQEEESSKLTENKDKVLSELINWLDNNREMVKNNNDLAEVLDTNDKTEALEAWLKKNNELDLLETNDPIEGLKVLLENNDETRSKIENMQLPPLPSYLATGGGLIVDPLTGKKHSINEKMGKSILKRYIKHYKDNK